MKYIKLAVIVLLASALVVSCKPAKDLSPEEFIKMENEVLSTDLTPESKEAVAKKYGYSLKQYDDYADKIAKDPAMKAKVGEIRLKIQQGKKI